MKLNAAKTVSGGQSEPRSTRLRGRIEGARRPKTRLSPGHSCPRLNAIAANLILHHLSGIVNEKHLHIVVRPATGTSYGCIDTYGNCNGTNHRPLGKTPPALRRSDKCDEKEEKYTQILCFFEGKPVGSWGFDAKLERTDSRIFGEDDDAPHLKLSRREKDTGNEQS
jgi:hypothetical protein